MGRVGSTTGRSGNSGAGLTGSVRGFGVAHATNNNSKPDSTGPSTAGVNGLTVAQATKDESMWLILLEALGAGLILVLIVWWTMFSGPSKDEDQEP
ncbi:MAG: hypothetical protein EBT70_14210 [Betaproteobacteria bacterium]|nr:hypothetical protein [Betaproteobacteria bacterium]